MPTKPNLNQLLAKWQPRLRLSDWDISIGWATARELPEDVGQNTFNPATGVSDIKIKVPEDITDKHHLYHNVELTVIHELLHLVFGQAAGWQKDDSKYIGLENSIEKVAKALLNI